MDSTALSPTLLPVAGATEPFWHRDLHPLHNHRSTEDLPESCDIVIIGAGYAGVGTAYNVVKGGGGSTSKQSITILEARSACSGASGRNGGHIRPDLYGHIPTHINRYGPKAAEEFAEYEISHVQVLKKLIRDEKIDCDFTLTRTCNAFMNQTVADAAKAQYEKLLTYNFPYMDDVCFTEGKAAEGTCGIQGAKACATYTAGIIWPYKFIMHLLSAALDTGRVNLQTNTPVLSVSENLSGGFIVKTARGTLHAKKVVHANNAYVAGLLPEYSASIIPCKGICCRITVLEGATAPLVNNSYIIHTRDGAGLDYLIPRADGSIIVGGASHTFRPSRAQWFNNVDDSTLVEAAHNYYDGYMQRTFRGWASTDAKVDKIWSGVMGYSADSLPHVGEVPGKKGQFIVAGFTGHGMPVIWLAAKGVAEMVRDAKPFEEVGLPGIMKTTVERIEKAQNGPEGGDIFNVPV